MLPPCSTVEPLGPSLSDVGTLRFGACGLRRWGSQRAFTERGIVDRNMKLGMGKVVLPVAESGIFLTDDANNRRGNQTV